MFPLFLAAGLLGTVEAKDTYRVVFKSKAWDTMARYILKEYDVTLQHTPARIGGNRQTYFIVVFICWRL